jgi:redox-sensitive bicupin YhaK (pirin superfamily)
MWKLFKHWTEEIPRVTAPDGKAQVTIWAGSYGEHSGLPPPTDSWGSNPLSNLGIYYISLKPGGKVTLAAATPVEGTKSVNRVAYFIEGSSLQVNGEKVPASSSTTLDALQDAEFSHDCGAPSMSEVLILQGSPIGEPVAQHGPFAMNTQGELQQAFADYQRTQFGGWPWPQNAMVFPREKGRFVIDRGVESRPPAGSA